MSDDNSGSFWRGLLLGGLIGAALGAALTAQADPEARSRLQKTTRELADRSRDVAAKGRDLSLQLLEQAGTQANRLLEQVQGGLSHETAALQEAIHAGVDAGREEIQRLRDKFVPPPGAEAPDAGSAGAGAPVTGAPSEPPGAEAGPAD